MNNRPIESARDPVLRLSYQALLRAAKRAREVALQTSTSIVINRNGVVRSAFAAIGWEWGGDWTDPKDYQHVSLNDR